MASGLDYYAPFFLIKIGGKNQSELKNAIISLEVDENLESAGMFTLNINEGFDLKTQKFRWLDNKLLDPGGGEDIEIYIGYASRGERFKEPLITGKITSLVPSFPATGIPSLTVQGYDKSFILQKKIVKDIKTYDKEKDYGNVARKIAFNNHLDTGDIDLTIRPCETITQNPGESDYIFLKRLADRIGYEFFVRNNKLYFRKPRNYEDEVMKLRWGRELISFNPRLSTAKVVSKVTVKGHNKSNPAEPIIGVATMNDIDFKEPGAKSASAAEFIKTSQGGEVETSEYNFPVCTEDDAKALAIALLIKANNNLIEGNCECIGIPELRTGTNIRIEGIGKRFSGKYYVKSTKHSIGENGYKLSFEIRRGGIGAI